MTEHVSFGSLAVARVPIFLAALLLVRGLPALVYRPLVGSRGAVAAGLLQATSLPFIVAATETASRSISSPLPPAPRSSQPDSSPPSSSPLLRSASSGALRPSDAVL